MSEVESKSNSSVAGGGGSSKRGSSTGADGGENNVATTTMDGDTKAAKDGDDADCSSSNPGRSFLRR